MLLADVSAKIFIRMFQNGLLVYFRFLQLSHHTHGEFLRPVFLKYASVHSNGQQYMTAKDFVLRFLQLFDEADYNEVSANCIARAVDRTKDGLISFEEFAALEALLRTSDALYVLAFEIFDRKGSGHVSFDDFKEVFRLTNPYLCLPFDFDCDFVKLHFGGDRSRKVTFEDFTQIIHDVSDEHAVQAFRRLDKSDEGTISAADFFKVITLLKSHLLTQFVRENLLAATVQDDKHGRITFAYFMGFINLLSNMEMVKKIYTSRTHGDRTMELTKEEFLVEAQGFAQITPLEIKILYQLASLLRPDGRLSYEEISAIAPIKDGTLSYHNYASALQEHVQRRAQAPGSTMFLSVVESCYRFTLGSIAGSIGATVVYPIDLVKTRMQNQRTVSSIGELLYRSSWDCFKKVVRFEGPFGLYRGLGPQLVGVAPEKAIKLTVNDMVREHFTSSSGHIPLLVEIFAGGCAGASQVVFTNPLEIIKIRLQVAGEIANTRRTSAFSVIKELGFFGLYKGSRACFLRDIPFSAIYFTMYSNLKMKFADENGYNSPLSLLAAATISGAPAASLTTPADVIKTRLQVVARAGQTTYNGILDAARKIWREEGGWAFWKGAGARVFRSSPQFGVTLLTYEMLQRSLYVDFRGR
ncbi:unnamed protein product [Calicophoron daubneyi]